MKMLSAVTVVLCMGLSVNASASLANTEFEAALQEQMGEPLHQKVANHVYQSKNYADGSGVTSVYWTGKKMFQKDDACLVIEQTFSHFEATKSEDGEVVGKDPVVEQVSSVKDCGLGGRLI